MALVSRTPRGEQLYSTISLMVTFRLTLGPEGMDQLSSGLSSKAVSQDKPHFLRTGLLIFSSFLLTVTVCPRHHSVILVSDSSSCPAALEKALVSLVPPFPSLKAQKFAFTHSFHLPLKRVPSCSVSPVLTGQSDLPPVSPTFRQFS